MQHIIQKLARSLALGLLALGVSSALAQGAAPNIVMIMVDDISPFDVSFVRH